MCTYVRTFVLDLEIPTYLDTHVPMIGNTCGPFFKIDLMVENTGTTRLNENQRLDVFFSNNFYNLSQCHVAA